MIQSRLIAAGVILLAFAACIIWALGERSARLACKADNARFDAQVRILDAALGQQNAALDKLAQDGAAARAKGAQARAAAQSAISGWTESQHRLEAALEAAGQRSAAAPTPTLAGGDETAGMGACERGLAIVREGLKP